MTLTLHDIHETCTLGQICRIIAKSVLPQPRADLVKRIEDIIFQFIVKRARVKKSVLKLEYNKGGLKVPDVLTVAKSLKVGWVKRFIDSGNKSIWKKLIAPTLMISEDINIF